MDVLLYSRPFIHTEGHLNCFQFFRSQSLNYDKILPFLNQKSFLIIMASVPNDIFVCVSSLGFSEDFSVELERSTKSALSQAQFPL